MLARPRYGHGDRTEVLGFSVALRPAEEGQPVIWFGGGRLGRDLALPALRARWDCSEEASRLAVDEWRSGPHHRAGGRETSVLSPAGWRSAAERVSMAADALGTVPATERVRWASAAREASGVFGAWAGRIERVAPGALSRASDALAWSAQTRRGEPRPAERDGVLVDFRGVAGVVAQAAIATDSAAGWALLIGQMSRTVQAIRKAHEQRGEALQGARLAALVSGELAELHARFERSAVAAIGPAEGRPDPRLTRGEPGRPAGFER